MPTWAESLAIAVAVILHLCVLVGLYWAARGVLDALEGILESIRSPALERLEAELGGLKAQVDGLPSVWSEYADKARRSEERARWERRRAAQLAQESDELEYEDVPPEHGGVSDPGGVQPVPAPVAAEPPIPEHIRAGWARKLGMS